MVVNCTSAVEIAKSLSLSAKTVNSYRYRIFDKLDVNGDVALTHMAIDHGILTRQNSGNLPPLPSRRRGEPANVQKTMGPKAS